MYASPSFSQLLSFGEGLSWSRALYHDDKSASLFWMLMGLCGLSDDSGVAGDGDRDVVAVADDEDMVKRRGG